jgi:hypothetical protein
MRLYVAKRSRVNVMKWYGELLSDGSRGSTYSASPYICPSRFVWSPLSLPWHTTRTARGMIVRFAKHGIDQDDIALHFVADQQTGLDSIEYFSLGPFYC